MDKILEALSKLVPADQLQEVSAAVEAMFAEAKTELEAEYNKNLEEAFHEVSGDLKEAEKVAEEGYLEAWGIISELRNRIETLRAEYDSAMEEGYEEAYQKVLEEKGKNEKIETDLYEAYEAKFKEAHDFMVNQLDKFLRTKGKDIYEHARRDIMADPNMVEHKLVLDKIVESVSDYITDEDRVLATGSKLEENRKALEDANGRIRMLEAKNIRLSTDNNKLNEQVKQAAELISESSQTAVDESKKARVEKAKNVSGRGKTTDQKVVEVVVEATNSKVVKDSDTKVENVLSEAELHNAHVLAGLKTND